MAWVKAGVSSGHEFDLTGLDDGSTYEIRVRAVTDQGRFSDWSDVVSKTVEFPKEILTNPSDHIIITEGTSSSFLVKLKEKPSKNIKIQFTIWGPFRNKVRSYEAPKNVEISKQEFASVDVSWDPVPVTILDDGDYNENNPITSMSFGSAVLTFTPSNWNTNQSVSINTDVLDFSLDAANTDPIDITNIYQDKMQKGLYVLDGTARKAFAYTYIGDRITSRDFNLVRDNADPRAISWSPIGILILDSDRVFIYTLASRAIISTGDGRAHIFLSDDNTNPIDIAYAADSYLVLDKDKLKVFAYNQTGIHATAASPRSYADFVLDSKNANPIGIYVTEKMVHVIDAVERLIFNYDFHGKLIDTKDVFPGSTDPVGAVASVNKTYILDADFKMVYQADRELQEKAYIVASSSSDGFVPMFELPVGVIKRNTVLVKESVFDLVEVLRNRDGTSVSKTLNVRLSNVPAGNVNISITKSNERVNLNKTLMHFNKKNWSVFQQVVVSYNETDNLGDGVTRLNFEPTGVGFSDVNNVDVEVTSLFIEKYSVEFRKSRKNNTDPWQSVDADKIDSHTVYDPDSNILEDQTLYEFRVRAHDNKGNSKVSDSVEHFVDYWPSVVLSPGFAKFTALLKDNPNKDVSITEFEMQYKRDTDSNWTDFTDLTGPIVVNDLPDESVYDVRVRGINADGLFSNWYDQSVDVDYKPIGVSIANDFDALICSWHEKHDPQFHEIRFRDTDFGDWRCDQSVPAKPYNVYKIDGQADHTRFEFQLRGKDSRGNFSNWTNIFSYDLEYNPRIESIAAGNNTALVKWDFINGSWDHYDIEWEETAETAVWNSVTDLRDNNYSISTPSTGQDPFKFRVRSVDVDGNHSIWSRPFIKNVKGDLTTFVNKIPSTPDSRAVIISRTLTDDSARVSWDASIGDVLYYQLQYREVCTKDWILVDNIVETSVKVSSLVDGKVYEFRIRAFSRDNGFSHWSIPITRTTETVTSTRDELYYVSQYNSKILYAYSSEKTFLFSRTFDLDIRNQNPTGLSFSNNRIFVLDIADNKVYVYALDGTRRALNDFNLNASNNYPQGMAPFELTKLVVVDAGDRRVYVYTNGGIYLPAEGFSLDNSNSSPRGIITTRDYIFVLDDDKVFRYNTDGSRQNDTNDFDLDPLNVSPSGMTLVNNDRIYVSDNVARKAFVYTLTGTRNSSEDFNFNSANDDPRGILNIPEGNI